MPRKEVYLSRSREGSRHSGKVHRPVTAAIAPERHESSAGRPAAYGFQMQEMTEQGSTTETRDPTVRWR